MDHTLGSVLVIGYVLFLRGASPVAVKEVRLSSPGRRYVLQGEQATLVCEWVVEPSEEVTEVEWEKDGALVYLWTRGEEEAIVKGVLEGNVEEGSSPAALAVRRVHMDMQGTWTCRVRTNGKIAHNEMFLMVIVDACDDSAWSTHSDMINCTEELKMHCVGIFPKPSPTCGVYSEKTGKYLTSIPFDKMNLLPNGTYSVGFSRRFSVSDWLNHPDISFRCYMIQLGTPWRSGITHKMFGDPGCEKGPPPVPHGHFNVSGDRSCWGFPAQGSRAEYQCHPGYQQSGPVSFVCSQGKWVPEDAMVVGDGTPKCGHSSGTKAALCSWTLIAVALFILSTLQRISTPGLLRTA